MAIYHLRLNDTIRVSHVLLDVFHNESTPPLTALLEALATEVAGKPDVAAALPVVVAPKLREAAASVRQKLIDRYGAAYVQDLLARLRK